MASETREELGVIHGPSFGVRDVGCPVLWFSVETLGGSALQVLSAKDALALIKDAQCYDIKNLEGRACVVDVGGGFIKFKRIRH